MHSDQVGQIFGLEEWMQERWLPSPLHKRRESHYPVLRSPFGSENQSMRNQRTPRRARHRRPYKSSKLASDWSSQTHVQPFLPIRVGAGEETAPQAKSQDKAGLE